MVCDEIRQLTIYIYIMSHIYVKGRNLMMLSYNNWNEMKSAPNERTNKWQTIDVVDWVKTCQNKLESFERENNNETCRKESWYGIEIYSFKRQSKLNFKWMLPSVSCFSFDSFHFNSCELWKSRVKKCIQIQIAPGFLMVWLIDLYFDVQSIEFTLNGQID